MSKSNFLENEMVLKLFNNTEFTWNAATVLYVSLHTADPGEAGSQTTSEATYTGYARVAVARTVGGWTIATNQASNAALLQFPQCTAGSSAVTHVAVGTAITGAGNVLYKGALSSTLNIALSIQPQFAIGALVVSEE